MDHYLGFTKVPCSVGSRVYELVKKFPRLMKVISLEICKLDGIHDIVCVRDLEFVILHNNLDMKEFLVFQDFVEQVLSKST